jgi:hypothetical protein
MRPQTMRNTNTMRKQIEKEVIEALYNVDATQSDKEYFAKWVANWIITNKNKKLKEK